MDLQRHDRQRQRLRFGILPGEHRTDITPPTRASTAWGKANRAKVAQGCRLGDAARVCQYPRYGWAWLLNRRVFYNNGEFPDDVTDVFVAPGYLSRLFTINTNTLADFSGLYRTYNTLKDKPDAGTGVGGVHVHPGPLPGPHGAVRVAASRPGRRHGARNTSGRHYVAT